MAARKFQTLLDKMPPQRRARVEAAREAAKREIKREMLQEDLKGIRRLLGLTQTQVAAKLKSSQAKVSLTEQREDHLVSTLRRHIEALGGDLDIVAHFGDRSIRLRSV